METAPSVAASSRPVDAEDDVRGPGVLGPVDALPRLAAFFLTAVGVVGLPLLLAGRFTRVPVLVGVVVVTVALELLWRRLVDRPAAVSRRAAVVSLLAVGVAVLSTMANARWGSQHILVDGDPAVYAVTGQLLAQTGSLEIPTLAQSVFGGNASLNYAGAGFDLDAGGASVRPSFMHLLPMVLAIASWLGGAQALLWANAVVSGAALLAVFALGARLLPRPEWSLLAMTALALSLPQQHFSRDTFSEIPAQLLVFAGIALLFDAVRSRRSGVGAGVLAGLVLGASCIARIDAFSYLIPLVVVATVLVLAGRGRLAAGMTGGTAVGAVLGYLDLRHGSPSYLGLQVENLNLILTALTAMTLLCAAALLLRRRAVGLWERSRGRALAASVVLLVLLLGAYAGVVRPLVEVGRHLSPQQPTAVGSLQKAAGSAVDPLRSYDELSLQWLTWYLGPAAVALGLLGLAVLVWRTLARQRSTGDAQAALAGLAFLLVFGASTALYLWRPSIVPVQYWATRRFLPVTIPGLLLLASVAASAVPGRRGWRPVAAVVATVALLAPPLVYLRGHATEREYVPMLAVTEQLCAVLEPDDAVVLIGGVRLSTAMPQTLRAFCGVPVAIMSGTTTPTDLNAIADAVRAAGRRPVFLSPVAKPIVAAGPVPGTFRPVVSEQVSVVALTLTSRPQEVFTFPMEVFLAEAP